MSQGSGPVIDVQATTIEKKVVGASYQRTAEEVASEFAQLDPGTISTAAVAWRNAGDRLGTLASTLIPEVAQPLSAAWSGDASAGPQNQLRLAHATVQELANQCMQMANAMNWAAEHAAWYKSNQPDVGVTKASVITGAVTTVLTGNVVLGTVAGVSQQQAQANQAATDHLERFMERYNEIIGILPDEVNRELLVPSTGGTDKPPVEKKPAGEDFGSTLAPQLPGNGGSAAGTAVGSGAGANGGSVPAIGQFTGTGTGGAVSAANPGGVSGPGVVAIGSGGVGVGGLPDPYAAGSLLAGGGNSGGLGDLLSLPGGSGTGTGGLGGSLGGGLELGAVAVGGLGAAGVGLGASGFGGAGLGGAGFGGAGFGSGAGLSSTPGAGGPGSGFAGGSGGGRPGTLTGLGARAGGEFPGTVSPSAGAGGSAGAAARGGMAPMQGTRGGQQDEDERSTWLTEDGDVWTDGRSVPPPLITE